MKKLLIFLVLGSIFFSCKKNKNDSSEKTILLSRMISNGHTDMRLYYNDDNKLIRLESFSSTIADQLVSSITLNYDAQKHLSVLTSYSEPGNVATHRSIIKVRADGKIDSAFLYNLESATPNIPYAYSKYNYNAGGNLIVTEQKDKNGDLISRLNLYYNPDGTLNKTESYKAAGGLLYLTGRTNYSVAGGSFPPGLDGLIDLLAIDYTAELFNETIQVFEYSQSGVITYNRTDQMSARQYGEDGTLERQTITRKFVKPAKPDAISQKEYEYIEQ